MERKNKTRKDLEAEIEKRNLTIKRLRKRIRNKQKLEDSQFDHSGRRLPHSDAE